MSVLALATLTPIGFYSQATHGAVSPQQRGRSQPIGFGYHELL
jgi:hypothetical protein